MVREEIAVCAFPFGKCNVPHFLQEIPEKKLRTLRFTRPDAVIGAEFSV